MKFLFYKPIKVSAPASDTFVWSDTHFNHKCEHWPIPLWKSRGYNSVDEHNEGLIRSWNNIVRETSTVFHLGDFIFGLNSAEHFKQIINRLNFNILYLMPGNHCSGWRQMFEQVKMNVWNIDKEKRVIFIPNYVEALVEENHFVLSHYPILSFNGQSKNTVCIYGHVHGKLTNTSIGKTYETAKTVEATVETTPAPYCFETIIEHFKNKPSICFD